MSWDMGVEISAQAGVIRLQLSDSEMTTTAYMDGESFAEMVAHLQTAATIAGFPWPYKEQGRNEL